ncbi:MAG: helix-turn-helix transcriptional regulator [Ferruginibacter sp.]
MKIIKDREFIRLQFSISQQDLANFLEVPRSQLSMYELNKRSLPKEALEKLGRLQLLHMKIEEERSNVPTIISGHERVQRHHREIKEAVKELIAKCEYKKLRLEPKLKAMQASHKKNAALAELVKHLLAEVSDDIQHKGDKMWANIQNSILAKKEITEGGVAQAMMEAKIAVLEKEIEEYKKVLDTID